MGVEFSADAERKRIASLKERNAAQNKWELYSSSSIVDALHTAKGMGWKEQRVQVRYDKDNELYYVEPFEKNCGCKGMLKYKDFFD